MEQNKNGLDELVLNMAEEGSPQRPEEKQENLMRLMDDLENPVQQVNEAGIMLDVLLSPFMDSDKKMMLISHKEITALQGVVTQLQYIYANLYENFTDAYREARKVCNPDNKKD